MRAIPDMRAVVIVLLGSFLAGCGNKPAAGPGRREAGKPVETKPPNARDQKPAFAGQTRAPFSTANVGFEAKPIAKDLSHPWSLAFLPDGNFLVTERGGKLLLIARDGTKTDVVCVPKVDARDQAGLLEVAIDPGFDRNAFAFLTYAEPRDGGNGAALARAKFVRDGSPRLEDFKVLWRMTPTLDSKMHFGSRIVFG